MNVNYRFYDEGKWIWLSGEEDFIAAEEMVEELSEGKKAYVVNHIGYKAHVQKDIDGELVWSLPCQHYKSEFYMNDEIQNDLLWMIL